MSNCINTHYIFSEVTDAQGCIRPPQYAFILCSLCKEHVTRFGVYCHLFLIAIYVVCRQRYILQRLTSAMADLMTLVMVWNKKLQFLEFYKGVSSFLPSHNHFSCLDSQLRQTGIFFIHSFIEFSSVYRDCVSRTPGQMGFTFRLRTYVIDVRTRASHSESPVYKSQPQEQLLYRPTCPIIIQAIWIS